MYFLVTGTILIFLLSNLKLQNSDDSTVHLSQIAPPTDLKKCKDVTYSLDWISTKFSSDFRPSLTVDFQSKFKPIIDGQISKFEFGVYYRDIKIVSKSQNLDIEFFAGKEFTQLGSIQMPRTIPKTLAIEVRLRLFNLIQEELSCVSFRLKFNSEELF